MMHRTQFKLLLPTIVLLLPAAPSLPDQAKASTATRLYLAFGGDFPLLSEPAKVDTTSYWCLSPFDWKTHLTGDMAKGASYTFHLGLANQLGSSSKGRLKAEILVKAASGEVVLATTTFDTSLDYSAKKATVAGAEASGHAGDVLLLRVTRLEGSPCLLFSGDTSDQFIEVPTTAIKGATR